MKKTVLIFALVFVVSCTKENTPVKPILASTDYLLFGHYFGECMGEQCIEMFKLEQNQISEDNKDLYSFTPFYDGNFIPLSEQKFDLAKDLINSFPADLLKETTNTFGCPDCADGGGLYIEYKRS